ncbi:S-methyl-5-thioribose-1-phosphate isomerase [Methanobrevibacter olleyae]|uniref:Putative methylthioribose-1-phosphate isomerase n=1 Tax=Methanobrevibacter olleyae TaxID=294671 RepID=A0A126R2C1_METOL|nr:S-methyl-5-thioribose-1-phosphate isomerase [Methanobrevibacter olleyae]AMK15785.1 translation initiation factor aIF-2B alpha subunit [Methanobrevibacter olleyae]
MRTLEWEDNKLKLIDQTKLPDELTYVYCSTYQDVIRAIKDMIVRGAPAIGVSAAFGMALAQIAGEDMEKAASQMKNARPTAVNLMWAVDRVMESDDILKEALEMAHEDVSTNLAIGEYGAKLIDDGDTVLTHCNAGALACVDYGTALGVFRSAFSQGKDIQVICDETRPRGQGASLSVWEMQEEGIPVKLIPDVASGYLMSIGKIDKVVIGADRVAHDGIANKIGSFMVALAAKHFNIPFYVAAPFSTFDKEISIFDTVIEERDPNEVIYYGGVRICPKGTEVINPAFDIVPKELITGVITENGVIDLNNLEKEFKDLF